MSHLELVWIRECEICAKEHQQIESIEDIATKSGAFKKRCENWYQSHIANLTAEQLALVSRFAWPPKSHRRLRFTTISRTDHVACAI